jgi:hypothetical protein
MAQSPSAQESHKSRNLPGCVTVDFSCSSVADSPHPAGLLESRPTASTSTNRTCPLACAPQQPAIRRSPSSIESTRPRSIGETIMMRLLWVGIIGIVCGVGLFIVLPDSRPYSLPYGPPTYTQPNVRRYTPGPGRPLRPVPQPFPGSTSGPPRPNLFTYKTVIPLIVFLLGLLFCFFFRTNAQLVSVGEAVTIAGITAFFTALTTQ